MTEDHRRLESGKFLLDIAKYILTGVAISSVIAERIDLKIAVFGFSAGVALAIVGVLILPPRKKGEEREGLS